MRAMRCCQEPVDVLRREERPVADHGDLQARELRPRALDQLEELRVQQGLALPLQLDVLQPLHLVDEPAQRLQGDVLLRHVPAGAEPAGEVAAGRGLDLGKGQLHRRAGMENANPIRRLAKEFGGEGGIRTHGTPEGTSDFESDAIDHSATSPGGDSKGAIIADRRGDFDPKPQRGPAPRARSSSSTCSGPTGSRQMRSTRPFASTRTMSFFAKRMNPRFTRVP